MVYPYILKDITETHDEVILHPKTLQKIFIRAFEHKTSGFTNILTRSEKEATKDTVCNI